MLGLRLDQSELAISLSGQIFDQASDATYVRAASVPISR